MPLFAACSCSPVFSTRRGERSVLDATSHSLVLGRTLEDGSCCACAFSDRLSVWEAAWHAAVASDGYNAFPGGSQLGTAQSLSEGTGVQTVSHFPVTRTGALDFIVQYVLQWLLLEKGSPSGCVQQVDFRATIP
jgi:hypothetical protein